MTNLCFRTFSNLFLSRGRGKRASLKASNLTGMSIHGMFEHQLPEFFKKRLHVEVNEDDQQAQKNQNRISVCSLIREHINELVNNDFPETSRSQWSCNLIAYVKYHKCDLNLLQTSLV